MEVPRGFTRCDECEGGGWEPLPPFDGTIERISKPCPSCSGSGLVPTDKLREEAVQAAFAVSADLASRVWGDSLSWEQVSQPVRDEFYARADAVLAKVAEHLGDRE